MCAPYARALRAMGSGPTSISIGDAVNLAILEEMVRDPTCLAHAEDLQAGSSYNIPANTQQAFGTLRAADEIIDEGHFIGKALGEGMNGYRPIVELMNANFGIYGMAELSSVRDRHIRPPCRSHSQHPTFFQRKPRLDLTLVLSSVSSLSRRRQKKIKTSELYEPPRVYILPR